MFMRFYFSDQELFKLNYYNWSSIEVHYVKYALQVLCVLKCDLLLKGYLLFIYDTFTQL